MNIRSLVKQVLVQKENKRYEKLLAARRMTYAQWLSQAEGTDTGSQNRSLETACPEEFCCFVASDGELAPRALQKITAYFQEHPEVMVVYGDEDVQEAGERKSPWFKPDWSPDLLDSCFYFGSVTAVRQSVLAEVEAVCREHYGNHGVEVFSEIQGSLYRVTDFAAYEKWIHLCVGKCGGYQKGNPSVGHIQEILFHCKNETAQQKFLLTSEYLQECREEALRDFREKWEISRNTEPERQRPAVSVIIPSKDHPEILEQCLNSCLGVLGIEKYNKERTDIEKTDIKKFDITTEIIVVDNGSSAENRSRIRQLIQRLNEEKPEGTGHSSKGCHPVSITYLYEPMDFNFSKMCNLGAAHAQGDFLLFLNDDVELCLPGCITQMAALADRFNVGAVGMKLYYPDSGRIQHAGITNLPMGPVHKLQFLEDDRSYYFDSNRGMRNVIAVTAACLMVEKAKFEEAGGFSTELAVAFNDVDFCFTLYEMGYRNVCRNDLYAYHHESLSRGDDESPEKLARLLAERDKLYRRHPKLENFDPYYSVHLNREGLDTRIRPAFETAGNEVQQIEEAAPAKDLSRYRQDPCVLLRVESVKNGVLHGYCVVLGDNNACYDKEILLISEKDTVYRIPVEGQYRPDLAENMPDQVNVGLCGFWMDCSKLFASGKISAEDSYRIGAAVRNRVSGLCLRNESNRFLEG